MTPISPKNLLRRTSLTLAALAAAWLVTTPASANTITYSSGETCSYSGMSVDPAGNVSVTCTAPATGGGIGAGGGTTPPPSGSTGTPTVYLSNTYAMLPLSASASGASGAPPAAGATVANLYIMRSNSSTGDITVSYNIGSPGCYVNGFPPPASGAVTLSGTALQSQAIGLVATAAGGMCSIAITGVSPAGGATIPSLTVSGITGTQQPNHVDIPVSLTLGGGSSGGGGTPPPSGSGGSIPVVAGCPTPPAGTAVLGVLPTTAGAHMANDGSSNGFWIEPSQVITAVALPTLASGIAQGMLSETYGVFSPQDPANYEIQISKCPGVIDTTFTQPYGGQTVAPACYWTTGNPFAVSLLWYSRNSISGGVTKTLSQLAAAGNCTADEAQGVWYANIRYTYTNCAQGTGKCGQQIQWNNNGS